MKKKAENKDIESKRPRKTKEKTDIVNQKVDNPKAGQPKIASSDIDLPTKRKLLGKLMQQPNWSERSMKECQQALEEVNWDYNALFVKKKRKRKTVIEEIIPEEETEEDFSEEITEEKISPKKEEYVPGLDSAWVLKYRVDWVPSEITLLEQVNRKLQTNYKSWIELSEKHENLSEEFLTQYEGYVSWYHLFKTHNPDNYSAKFKKKMHDHFLVADLDLVPRTYKKEKDNKKVFDEE